MAAARERRQRRAAGRLGAGIGYGVVNVAESCLVTFAVVTHSIERSARVPGFVRRVRLFVFVR